MEKLELNKKVKNLKKSYTQYLNETKNLEEIKKEITDVYFADTSLKSLTKDNLMILLRINLSIRAIPLHLFGIDIEH